MYHAVFKRHDDRFRVLRGREWHSLVRNSFFVFKELGVMNIMAAGSKTKVQDVNLKCTCPVWFSWQGIIGCKGMDYTQWSVNKFISKDIFPEQFLICCSPVPKVQPV